MSLIDFYCSGPSAKSLAQWNHECDTYSTSIKKGPFGEPDISTTHPKLRKNQDEHRIKPKIKAPHNHEWTVDEAVIVTATHHYLDRKRIIDFWDSTHTITFVSGVVSTLLGVGACAASFFVTATWLKVTCIVAAVALVVFGFISLWRSTDASDQIELWTTVYPQEIVRDARSSALEAGFGLLQYSRHELLTRKEITYLLENAFSMMHTKLQEAEKGDNTAKHTFVRLFADKRLLDAKETPIAYKGQGNPLAFFHENYAAFKKAYDHVQNYFEEQRRHLTTQKFNLRKPVDDRYDQERNAIQSRLRKATTQAEKNWDEASKKAKSAAEVNQITEKRQRAVKEATDKSNKENQDLQQWYTAETSFIDKAHNHFLGLLDHDETLDTTALYVRARDLFLRAYSIVFNQTLPKFIPYNPYWNQMEDYIVLLKEQAKSQKKSA